MTIDVHDLVNVWEFHIQQIFFLSVFCEYFFWRPQIGVPKEFIQLILSLCSPQDLFIWFFAWFFFRVYTMMTIHSLYWGLLMAVISFGSIFFQQIFFFRCCQWWITWWGANDPLIVFLSHFFVCWKLCMKRYNQTRLLNVELIYGWEYCKCFKNQLWVI
jgi:hypothetical protein